LAGDAAAPAAAPQQPPSDQSVPAATPQNPLPGTAAPSDAQQNPLPDAAATAQTDCIDETGDYVTHGAAVTYVIGLENKCDKRLSCKIFAYVVGARGPASGQTTMILGGKSNGAAAKKTYTMKVKAAGGMAQVSRECREF
jgi:hypothetical protein